MILSFHGGGVRGVLSARIVDRLEAQAAFLERVTYLAGSSVGAINATWIACGRPISELVDVYRKAAPVIFGAAGKFATPLLRSTLKSYLGDLRMRDLKRPVLAGAVTAKGPVWFSPTDTPDELLVDVVLAATAIPPLAPHKGHVDGGILANDPAPIALEWAPVGQRLLSVGTGKPPTTNTGLLATLANAAVAGQSFAAEKRCREVLGANYHVVQPTLPRAIGLEEAGALAELVRCADDHDLTTTVSWLR